MGRRVIYDVETNGLLDKMTCIHCLVALDIDTKEWFIFRRNEEEDTVEEGVRFLEECDARIGHNIIGFDEKAIQKVFPDYDPQGELIDTLIVVRTLPVDFKRKDFDLAKRGGMPGKLIGKHSLDTWGYRVGKNKGDYSAQMKAKGLDPWAAWNQDMEDYCVNDVEVNYLVWLFIERFNLPEKVRENEQEVQSLVTYMEQNGYPFLQAEALKLAEELESEFDRLVKKVSIDVRGRFVPEKKHVVAPIWNDPDGINAQKRYAAPREAYGEDMSRPWWGDITIPKQTIKSSDPTKRGDRTEGAPYCKIKWKEFSPTSRPQVAEFLRDHYKWQPTEWTDKGNPQVDDKELRALADRVPYANDLADIFMIQKLLGYLKNGTEAWTRKYNPETECIHPYTNTGGTVTGRCSHHGPNIGQVPSVHFDKGPDGKEYPIFGKAGRYGYECRRLFHTPELVYGVPWKQVGADLSGIEFRMLAEETAQFDNGELISVVTDDDMDIHAFNMSKTGVNDRGVMKRGTYGLLYGAGDPKLGLTIAPDADPADWKDIGAAFRRQLMTGLPALEKVISKIKGEAERGYILAIDGRRIFVRSEHSALNTKLQSSGAIVAKRWIVLAEQKLMEAGLDHGWEGDFCFLAFVHDEVQCAVKEEYAEMAGKLICEAAVDAGLYYNLKCPIAAEYKIGQNWAECH